MQGATFPYKTKIELLALGPASLEITRLSSLDETIDEFFKEYEKTGDTELFASLCPYFGEPWPAGVALARYCGEQAARWNGASILEVGCGLALPSLVLAKLGLSRLTATDLHPDVPVFLRENCRLNSVNVNYEFLDWQGEGKRAQVILGSDLCYDRESAPALVDFLAKAEWNEAVIADPGRPYWDSFLKRAKEKWETEEFLRDGIFFARLGR